MLAGKVYWWNEGFKRHPFCNCVHQPCSERTGDALTTDPYALFNSLTEEEQDKTWGRGAAQAIRDGADIFRVANAKRPGSRVSDLYTPEGTHAKRGFVKHLRGRRLTPEGIYRRAGSREEAIQLLTEHGYLIGGQSPEGIVQLGGVGFGTEGRGGTRKGASMAFREAHRMGVRKPGETATMTAAERRLFNAQGDWEEVLAGRNPHGSSPLTPQIAAGVEQNYRRWLATGGQIFL
jgi:hypothetical protein